MCVGSVVATLTYYTELTVCWNAASFLGSQQFYCALKYVDILNMLVIDITGGY